MELVDGGDTLTGEPYPGGLDEGEGDDGPVDPLALEDGGVDLGGEVVLLEEEFGTQRSSQGRGIGGSALEDPQAGFSRCIYGACCDWLLFLTHLLEEATA